MSTVLILVSFLLSSSSFSVTEGQTCDSETISEVIFTDLTSTNSAFTSSITFAGDVVIDTTGTSLTNTTADSYGGFFFNSATDFQGPGGFSVKFVLQSGDTSSGAGDAWEFIVAGSSNLDIVKPPYTDGSGNNGLSGWSRLNALVVEFDALNSGSENGDESTNHVAVYLAGSEMCSQDVGISFGSGDQYTIWVDYNGFSTSVQIRISDANLDSRPDTATLDCSVDIWSIMDISGSNHIGFMAYNPSSGGAEHSLVDTLSIADAYRPYDSTECAAYASCAQKTVTDGLCLTPIASTTCSLGACDAGYVWDLSGSDCCAFIEKGTWKLSDLAGTGPFSEGQVVDCEQIRRTIAFPTNSSNC